MVNIVVLECLVIVTFAFNSPSAPRIDVSFLAEAVISVLFIFIVIAVLLVFLHGKGNFFCLFISCRRTIWYRAHEKLSPPPDRSVGAICFY